MLIVLKQYVISGLKCLNKIAFKSESLCFIGCDYVLEILNMRNHGLHLGRLLRTLKILPYPVFKVYGFAHVYYLSRSVVHLVYAGAIREQFEFF